MKFKTKLINIFLISVLLTFSTPINQVLAKTSTKAELLQIVLNYQVEQDNPYPYFHFDQEKLELDINQTTELKLLDKNNQIVTDTDWYFVERNPYDKIFSAIETKTNTQSIVKIDGDNVTARAAGHGHVIAVYHKNNQEYIHKINLNVRNQEETKAFQRNKLLQDKTKQIIAQTNGLTDVEKVIFANDWLVNNIVYDNHYYGHGHPYYPIVKGKAVCEGYAKGFKYLMDKMGIETKYVTGYVISKSKKLFHAWNAVKIDDGWYYVDPTWSDLANHGVGYAYVLEDKQTLSRDHLTFSDNLQDADFGSKYKLYPIKKAKILINNQADLTNFVKRIKDATKVRTAGTIKIAHGRVLIKNNLSPAQIKQVFANNLTDLNISNLNITQLTAHRYKNHKLYEYNFDLNNYNPQSVTANITTETSSEHNSNQKLTINLTQPVELKEQNFKLNNAILKKFTKLANNKYELFLSNIVGNKIDLEILKLNYIFSNNPTIISANLIKASTPSAFFTGISKNSGILTNIQAGDQIYLDHKWTSASENMVINSWSNDQLMLRRIENGKINSDIQVISIKSQNAPSWVVADDNQIKNVSYKMEYQPVSATNWTEISENVLKNILKGEYAFRLKARPGFLPSEEFRVTINKTKQENAQTKPNKTPKNEQKEVSNQNQTKQIQEKFLNNQNQKLTQKNHHTSTKTFIQTTDEPPISDNTKKSEESPTSDKIIISDKPEKTETKKSNNTKSKFGIIPYIVIIPILVIVITLFVRKKSAK